MNPQGGGENSYSDREFRSTQPARKKIHTIATQTRKRQIHGVNFFIPDDRETQKPLSRARQADRIRLRRERTALVQPTQASFCRKIWRRGWDSNPRYGFPHARFRGEYFQPLSHLSAAITVILADPPPSGLRRVPLRMCCASLNARPQPYRRAVKNACSRELASSANNPGVTSTW